MEQLQQQIDYLTNEDIKKNKEIEDIKIKLKELKKYIEEIEILNKELKEKSVDEIVESCKNDNGKKTVSIIISQYKKSLLVKNQYSTHNTTIICKNILKDLGGKWAKIEGEQCWIFVGVIKEETLEENSKFLIENLKKEEYEIEVKYQ